MSQSVASASSPTPKLRRVLGFRAIYGTAVGLVVSGTAMFSVGNVTGFSGKSVILVALIALVPMLTTAFAYSELSVMLPGGGMISDYTMPALGKFWAVFALFSGYLVLIATDGGTQVVMGGLSLQEITGIPFIYTAVAILVLCLVTNIIGVKFYGAIQGWLTVIMMVAFALLAVFGFFGVGGGEAIGRSDGFIPEGGSWGQSMGQVGAAIWFYIGFEFACPLAEETKQPQRSMPIGLIAGLFTIFVCDALFSYGAAVYTDLSVLQTSSIPHIEAAKAMSGQVGYYAMTILTILAALTSANAELSALPRMLYGLSRQGMAPTIFGNIHPRFRVPLNGIIVTALLITITMVYLSFQGGSSDAISTLIAMACFTWMCSYIIAMLDVLVLRKKYPDFPRLYKAPMPFVTLPIGIIACIYCIYTLSSVWIPAVASLIIISLYSILWSLAHHQPINPTVPITQLVHDIRERSEKLPEWDERVEAWILEQSKTAQA